MASEIPGYCYCHIVSWGNTHTQAALPRGDDCASLRTVHSAAGQWAAILTCIGFASKGLVSWAQAAA